MGRKNKNNGVINNGSGDVVVTDTVIGDPAGTNPDATNNGVVNNGSGNVVITGSVMGTGNHVVRH
jgi:hypothetical protein